jgi:hypothetical protein
MMIVMDLTSQQLKDLVAAYGQREAGRRLGKPQRQIWGWLAGEHAIRRANRAAIERAWTALQQEPQGIRSAPAVIRHLRALPGRKPADARRTDADDAAREPIEEGVYVLLDDYGARHGAGALARSRPQRHVR